MKRIQKMLLAAVLLAGLLAACGEEQTYGSFSMPADEAVAALQTDLEQAGYAGLFADTPEQEDVEGDSDRPDSLRRTYLAEGMVLETYSLAQDSQLYQIVLMAEMQAMEGREEVLQQTFDWFVRTFESQDGQALREELNLSSLEDGADAQAEGTDANWIYFIEDGFLFLSVTSRDYVESVEG